MNYADMEAAIARDKFAKAKGRKAPDDPVLEPTEVARAAGPSYRPELETGTTPDLFARVVVVDEYSLGKRLQQQDIDADLFCVGDFTRYSDRLRHVITVERLATAICGRNPGGKVETFAEAFERVCFEPLVLKSGARR